MATGEDRRDDGMAAAARVTDPEWLENAEDVFLTVLSEYGEVSSNDVRAECGIPCDSEGCDRPNAMGAFINRMVRTYNLVEVRREPTRWPDQQARGGGVPVYRRKL